MTEQEQKAFNQMREALELHMAEYSKAWKPGMEILEPIGDAALTAANAVSHPKPETTPLPEGGAITSESAANAVSHPQATEPAGWKLVPVEPTDAMANAAMECVYQHGFTRTNGPYAVYRAMLAAAPEAP